MSNVRVEVGITEFMHQAKAAGRSTDTAYRLYLSGKDPEEESVTAGEWLERGVAGAGGGSADATEQVAGGLVFCIDLTCV